MDTTASQPVAFTRGMPSVCLGFAVPSGHSSEVRSEVPHTGEGIGGFTIRTESHEEKAEAASVRSPYC